MTTYEIPAVEKARLESVFTYHPVKGDQADRYVLLRNQAKELAESISTHCPPGRERALALTKLEEAIMFANASIARGE